MNMSHSFIAGISLVALVACGGGAAATNTTPSNHDMASSDAAPAAGTFLISNQSSVTICYAMFSPASDPNWGPDQLGQNVIPAGGSYAWTVGVGVWDVKLEDCNHNQLLDRRGVDIQGAGTVLTVTN